MWLRLLRVLPAGALAAMATVAFANCGSIPFVAGAQVYRPYQRAVAAFDGREQVLLLSTDLRADRHTKVLEVLTFPSKPIVSQGDEELFQKAAQLIDDRLAERQAGRRAPGRIGTGGRIPNGSAAFHERIQVQGTSVVQIPDSQSFIAWVHDYLRKAGVDEPEIPLRLRSLVRDCVRDGFTWFVFNVIEVGPETAARPTLQYRFATHKLYYPLRIMGTESGNTTIRLVLVSPRLVIMPDIRPRRAVLLHHPITVSRDDLSYLGGGLTDFFDRSPQQLRLWEIKGLLNSLRRDVLTDWF